MIILINGKKQNAEKFLKSQFEGQELITFDLSKIENPKEEMQELKKKEDKSKSINVFLSESKDLYRHDLIYLVHQSIEILDENTYQYLKNTEENNLDTILYY